MEGGVEMSGDSSNIFELSRGFPKKPSKNPAAHTPPLKKETALPPPPSKKEVLSDEMVKEKIERMHILKQELQDTLVGVMEKGGITAPVLKHMIKGFSSEQKKDLKIKKHLLEEKISKAVGKQVHTAEREENLEQKVRKSKSLGNRKKWIPMR